MPTTMYELRCRQTLAVKMFVGLSAEKAARLNEVLRAGGSSCRFVPQTPSGVERSDGTVHAALSA